MASTYTTEDRLFDLKGYVTDALEDVIQAAHACDNEAAKADLTDEVMRLFEASTGLCYAMRRFALAEGRAPQPDAGIRS